VWQVYWKLDGYSISVGKVKKENHFEDLGIGGRIILKCI
jgi:hypothetical protein